MYNDKVQADLKMWFSELRDAKRDMPVLDAIADPIDREMKRMFLKHRIERIETNIDRIMEKA